MTTNDREISGSGFSLVELSIVLVILGLLTGGILAGQSLIRAAQLRAVNAEYQRYSAAISSFRDKYFALPGDMTNAVRFWGAQAGATADGPDATCIALLTAATSAATCNGNGDGQLNSLSGNWYERYRFWQHLANAGLIEGQYSGVTSGATVSTSTSTTGVNVPASKFSNGAWYFGYWGDQTGASANWFAGSYGNALLVGANVTGSYSFGALFNADEAWNFDVKTDDGLPGSGKVMTPAPTANANCTAGGTSATPLAAAYAVTYSGAACSLIIKSGY